MEQVGFQGKTDSLEFSQVIRDYEYSMVARHFHDTYELYYLLEGQRYYFIDRQTYLVKAGDVVMIKPNQIHKTSMAGESYHNRILLQIQGQVMEPFLKASGMGGMDAVYAEDAMILSIPEEERKDVEGLLLQIWKEIQERQRQYEVENQKVQTWKHQKVHEVADYLLNHPETDESLEELARRFYISKSYLSRIFRQVTSFTVNEYKNINRIKKSQQLLLHSSYSVTEISELLGFENLTYYERVFKKYTGMTPLKYRKIKT